MGFSSLAEWLHWQEGLHPSEIELGLDRVRAVAGRLSFYSAPHLITVIVGGTNGKGSCVAYLESILLQAGYRVGAYTSPHLFRYNERIRVNGVAVSDEQLCDSFSRIDQARYDGKAPISLTYFEWGTLAALDIFSRNHLQIQILEVGLGGRLDAVNLADADVSIVTNVALDHEQWLGDTLEQIACEKAGIFRPDRPAIFGDPNPPESLLQIADEMGVELLVRGRDFGLEEQGQQWGFYGRLADGSRMIWQGLPPGQLPAPSAACALQALACLGFPDNHHGGASAVSSGLAKASLPGRFQMLDWRGRQVILDVAHNPAGAAYLARELERRQLRPVAIVFSALADKDITGVLSALEKDLASPCLLAELSVPRAARIEILQQCASQAGVETQVFDTIAGALNGACRLGSEGDTLLVCGSFYTVAAALDFLS
jgi:dihydrofolate synthase/folylpolyglutamate synthase